MTYLLPKLAFRSFIGFDDFFNEIESYAERQRTLTHHTILEKLTKTTILLKWQSLDFLKKI